MTIQEIRNHWLMFGVANCVPKVGSRHWAPMYDWPRVYPTKREAMMAVDAYILEIGRRRFDD